MDSVKKILRVYRKYSKSDKVVVTIEKLIRTSGFKDLKYFGKDRYWSTMTRIDAELCEK